MEITTEVVKSRNNKNISIYLPRIIKIEQSNNKENKINTKPTNLNNHFNRSTSSKNSQNLNEISKKYLLTSGSTITKTNTKNNKPISNQLKSIHIGTKSKIFKNEKLNKLNILKKMKFNNLEYENNNTLFIKNLNFKYVIKKDKQKFERFNTEDKQINIDKLENVLNENKTNSNLFNEVTKSFNANNSNNNSNNSQNNEILTNSILQSLPFPIYKKKIKDVINIKQFSKDITPSFSINKFKIYSSYERGVLKKYFELRK